MLNELPENNLEVWNGSQGSKVGLLPVGYIGVIRSRANVGGEVLDLQNLMGWQQEAAQRGKVQPFVLCSLNHTVVEIEPVNIDISPHKKAEAGTVVPASRPAPEEAGGIIPLSEYAPSVTMSSRIFKAIFLFPQFADSLMRHFSAAAQSRYSLV
jgi:hypothetical protein